MAERKRAPIVYEEARAKIEAEDSYPLEMPNGEVFYLLPPQLMSDDQYLNAMKMSDEEAAKIMINDFEGYRKAGGTILMLATLVSRFHAQLEAEQGASQGE